MIHVSVLSVLAKLLHRFFDRRALLVGKKDFASYKPRANSNGDLVPLDVEEVLFEEVYTFSVL